NHFGHDCRSCAAAVYCKYHKTIVLQNLLMDMMSFYSVYYILVSLCIGIFRVDSLLAHFDYTTQPSSPKYVMTVISMELSYLSGGLIFAWIVEEWVWDYAIPVNLIHIDLTVAGKQQEIEARGEESHCPRLFRNNFVYPEELQNF
uniref:Uncharacterized protein n=1 Tax=Salmo trutta TaxID=8032 RepID=A0A674A8R4_SALTR